MTAIVMFTLGTSGIMLNRENLILTIMSMELMFLSSAVLLLLGSIQNQNMEGQAFTLLILTIAAAESAMGLAMLMAYYSLKGSMSLYSLCLLHH